MKHSLEAMKVYKDFIESPSGIILDGFMNAVPGYNGAWVAMRNAVEQNKNMKILRGLELLVLFKDEKFQKEFLDSEEAIDGFGLCFEAIVKQRNEKRRSLIKQIFKGFIKLNEEEQKELEIERFLLVIERLGVNDIIVLEKIHNEEIDLTISHLCSIPSKGDFQIREYGEVKYLESLGIFTLHTSTSSEMEEIREGDEESGYFATGNYEANVINIEYIEYTDFGVSFISYLFEDEKA